MLFDSFSMFKIVESLWGNNNINNNNINNNNNNNNNNKIASVRNVSQNISLCNETLKLKRIHANNVNKSFSHNRTYIANVWIHILMSLFLAQLNFSGPWEIILNKNTIHFFWFSWSETEMKKWICLSKAEDQKYILHKIDVT